jgi:anthranilate phosphoribosyltransferase
MPYLKQLLPLIDALGWKRTLIVQGMEGHEDVATSRGTRLIELEAGGEPVESRIDVDDLGLVPASEDDLAAGDAARSARMTLAVLDGVAPPSQRDLVLLNAALRIRLARRAPDIASALALGRDALASGEAARKLRAWRDIA